MKITKTNGEIIECTIEEYKILFETTAKTVELQKVAPIQKRKYVRKVPVNKKQHRKNSWSKEEDTIIEQNFDKGAGFVHLQLPHRTIHAIEQRYYTTRKKVAKEPVVRKPITAERRDKLTERINFINQRAKYYVQKYNWSYEKSRIQAGQDYKHGKTAIDSYTKTTNISVQFPKLSVVTNTKQVFNLKFMINNMIFSNRHILTYDEIKSSIEPDEGTWNFAKWNEFIASFIFNSGEISKCFRVENKFKLLHNGEEYISYG